MSWELAAMVVLGAALLGGFAWYEHSRPPSQIVALVAALAAISVAGRVAFSPIPNVVPTTDITLIAGYALGGAPGFAVGALSGLVSNFWLGQGPWTPWQMAGWGMTGLLGAWLALLTRRHVGRFGLAAVCAFAGFAYGALLDFSLMVTYGGEQSLDRFLAISARGIPFNIAHAAGNAALALVAGPAMVRMLLRYRSRFEFAWKGRGATAAASGAAAGVACLIAALLIASSGVQGERADAAGGGPGAGVAWLRSAQNDDGGFGFAPGEESSPAMTGWAVLGLESAGINPLDLDHGDATPISYLAGNVGEITTTGDIERTILLLRGSGLDPRRFQGHDLVRRLLARRGKDGSWGGQVNQTAFGILALRGAGVGSGNARTAGWLRDHQNSDGGWGFAAGAASDADTTGACGATGSRRIREQRRNQTGSRISPKRPAARRRFPAERRRDQRPVHRLRGPGAARRGRLTVIGARGWPFRARLSRLRPGSRWPLSLLELERPDPGLGHRPGPAGRQRRRLPARSGVAEGQIGTAARGCGWRPVPGQRRPGRSSAEAESGQEAQPEQRSSAAD